MKISAFVHERSACTHIRIKQVVDRIGRFKLADTQIITRADPETDNAVKSADVVFLGRAGGPDMVNMMKALKHHGKNVVYDLDDSIFAISPFSPHYRDFGIMPVEFDTATGGKGVLWKDGQMGFDVARNRKMRKAFIEILREAACVTVSTPPLEKIYGRFNDNVRVVPNAIDFGIWQRPPVKWERDEVRLLYTGAANHQEDWLFVAPVLAELQKEHPKLKIVLVGSDWKNIHIGVDYSRVECHPWVDIEAYPYLIRGLCCDIGIAPISKIDFNDCRSSIKWAEYSSLQMASVLTGYGPYQRDCKDGVNALLVDTKSDWKAAIAKLIEDEGYRLRLAEEAYRHCKAHYDLDYMVDIWMSAFTSVKGRN